LYPHYTSGGLVLNYHGNHGKKIMSAMINSLLLISLRIFLSDRARSITGVPKKRVEDQI
jgi:hypothetical protein